MTFWDRALSSCVRRQDNAVSLGPELHDVHSVKEKLSVPSTKLVYEMTLELLKRSRYVFTAPLRRAGAESRLSAVSSGIVPYRAGCGKIVLQFSRQNCGGESVYFLQKTVPPVPSTKLVYEMTLELLKRSR